MATKDLFKESIADARKIYDIALEHAKEQFA